MKLIYSAGIVAIAVALFVFSGFTSGALSGSKSPVVQGNHQAAGIDVQARVIDNRIATDNQSAAPAPVIEDDLSAYVNDPYNDLQWALTKINVFHLWANTPDGANVLVAILDTGIDKDHEDLRDKDLYEKIINYLVN